MAIHYHIDNLDTWKFLELLGFSSERIQSEQGITDEELHAHGMNPDAVKAVADPTAPVDAQHPEGPGDYYLSAAAAERGTAIVETLGGRAQLQKLTAASSCAAQPGNLRFVLDTQVLRTPQEYPNHGFGSLGAFAYAAPCPYDPTIPATSDGVLFPVTELPALLRTQALPSLIAVYEQDNEDGSIFRRAGTAVVISQHGHLLTNRHVVATTSHDDEERQNGKLRIADEAMPERRFIQNTSREMVPLHEAHVLKRFPGYDLALLKVPALAGHPYATLRTTDAPLATPHVIIGHPQTVYHPADHRREGLEYDMTQAQSDACHERAGENYEKQELCDEQYEAAQEKLFSAPNLADSATIFWSTGEMLPLPTDAYFACGPAQYHSTALVRPGMSGGPVFIVEHGAARLIGIANAVHIPNHDPKKPGANEIFTNSTLGVRLEPFQEYLRKAIAR